MSTIPSNIARVPLSLSNQVMLGSLLRTQRSLLNTELQLASGLRVMRPSDDAISASAISVLDDVIERRDQRMRNMNHGESVLNNIDAALADASEIVLEAKGIASSQIGVGSTAETRENQATVIDAMLNEMYSIANRQYQRIHFFGGSSTAEAPMQQMLGGIRYAGQGEGIVNDLGVSLPFPITMSGEQAFGSLSSRVQGDRDLDPTMVSDTRLTDLLGAKGLGVRMGTINADIGGVDVEIDLTTAHTIGDVVSMIETALQTVDPGATVAIDSATNNRIAVTPSAGVDITFSDIDAEAMAADLGIDTTFTGGATTAGSDLNPLLTEQTLVSSLTGVTSPLGTVRLSNAGQTRDLDLSAANTVQDIMNAVAGLNIGIRVEIADTGDRLNFINELSGGTAGGMSVGEVGGGSTASELGVRSLTGSTLLEDFNNGLGVSIRDGSVDPITGAPDPAEDFDFRITLKDGRTIDVDLPGDAQTVQDVLDEINAAAAAAGVTVPGEFEAALASDGNGIALTDNTVGTTTSVASLNGSFAAENLGILGSTTSATLTGEDRATVAVDSVFSHLIALRDALRANDERGITLAGEKIEQDVNRLAGARAENGVRARRMSDAVLREEELQLQDTALRSEVQDLDYTEAAIRFSTLQQQLQAALASTAQISSLSLLDFLT